AARTRSRPETGTGTIARSARSTGRQSTVKPQLLLFDDARAAGWQPFTLTRPAGELLFGAHTMRARAELVFGVRAVGHIAPGLDGFTEPDAAPVLDATRIAVDAPRIVLLSRAVPSFQKLPDWPHHTTRIVMAG